MLGPALEILFQMVREKGIDTDEVLFQATYKLENE